MDSESAHGDVTVGRMQRVQVLVQIGLRCGFSLTIGIARFSH